MTSALPHEFDRRASDYERHAPVQREAAQWLAEWLPGEIEHPALELGAGTGLFTRHLVGRTKRLVASDIAPRMVQAGIDRLPDAVILDQRLLWVFVLLVLVIKGGGLLSLDTMFKSAPSAHPVSQPQ